MMPGYTAKTRRQARTFGLAVAGRDKRQQRRLVRRMAKHYARIGSVLGLSAEEAYGMLWTVDQRMEYLRGEILADGFASYRVRDYFALPIINDPDTLIVSTGI